MRAHIRAATTDDAAAITALIATLGYPTDAVALRRLLPRLIDASRVAIVVAELEGAVVGMLTLCARPSLALQGWVGTIGELVVDRGWRGFAIGEALLQYAKGLAVEQGLSRLECEVPDAREAPAAPFLFDRGFAVADLATFRWSVLESRHPRLPALGDGAGRRAMPV